MFHTLRLLTATTSLFAGTAVLDQSTYTSVASEVVTAGVVTHSHGRARLAPGADATALNSVSLSEVRLANAADAGAPVIVGRQLIRPHVLDTLLADVLVRIRGGAVCTGTPITRTNFVVTAAHCVLDADGAVADFTKVLRDGVEYTPVSVLVNPDYHKSPGPLLDAAVLVMDQMIPGPSAALGDEFPSEGPVTVAGFQPLDVDGSLLRGTRVDNRPLPQGVVGGVVKIDTAVAGCVELASQAEVANTYVKLPCGLIPGASGGGAFVENNNEWTLVGIISTVARDLTFNGLVPLAALHELLENPAPYTYSTAPEASAPSVVNVVRS